MDDPCSLWFRIFINRLGRVMLVLLVGIDQVIQTLLTMPFYLIGMAALPNADETISGLLGRKADIYKWALVCSLIVDALFLILTLGKERWHCKEAAERESLREMQKNLASFSLT